MAEDVVNNWSERRLAENEVIFREANKSVQEFIKDDLGRADDTVVRFYCECSHMDCQERIAMTAADYELLHGSSRQFTVLAGHEIPQIEKIVKKFEGFNVVEKYGEPPPADQIEAALHDIKT